MHLRGLFAQALGWSLLFASSALGEEASSIPEGITPVDDTPAPPILKASGTFISDDLFPSIVNGQRNVVSLRIENGSPNNVTIQSALGSLINPQTGNVIKNTSTTPYGFPLDSGGKITLPYSFFSEFKPSEVRFKVYVNYVEEGKNLQLEAYDGLVTVVEPPSSLFDWRLLSTYGFVLALLGGAGYLTYLSFFPAPKKKKVVQVKPTNAMVDTPVTPGSGVYSEDWIPSHHIKKPKGKREGALSSGDEKSGTDSDIRRRGSKRTKA